MKKHKKLIILYVYDALKYGSSKNILCIKQKSQNKLANSVGFLVIEKQLLAILVILRSMGATLLQLKAKVVT